jgi:hypothetical protein
MRASVFVGTSLDGSSLERTASTTSWVPTMAAWTLARNRSRPAEWPASNWPEIRQESVSAKCRKETAVVLRFQLFSPGARRIMGTLPPGRQRRKGEPIW